MVDLRISQLTPAKRLSGGERLAGTQAGASVAVTTGQLAAFARPAITAQVASRCLFNRAFATTPKQMMCRTYHKAMDDIDALQILEANWYNSSGTETGTGGTATVGAAIEYPLNSCTRVTWGDQPTGSVASNANLLSDLTAVAIPRGAWFAVRRYVANPSGIAFASVSDQTDRGFGVDVFGYAPSGLADQTMTNAPVTTAQAPGLCAYPAAIVARTRRSSFAIVGDSRSAGALTTSSTAAFDGEGNLGEFAGALHARGFATLNGGVFGTTAAQFVASHARQAEAMGYCSHVVLEHGINDLTGGRTAAQIQADLLSIAGYFPRAQAILGTTPPVSTSTDGWTTTAGQTTHASNPVRVALNAWKRQVPRPFADCWEIADLVETARGSGIWKAGLTGDGTHESASGYQAIAADAAWATQVVRVTV